MQIGWLADTTSRFAFLRPMPPPGQERQFLDAVVRNLSGKAAGTADVRAIAAALKAASAPVLILSAELLDLSSAEQIMPAIERIMALTDARLLAVPPYGNLAGLLTLISAETCDVVSRLVATREMDTLYLVGERPFAARPAVNAVIYQGVFPPPDSLAADLILPSATFGEIAGSYYDGAGERKKFLQAVDPRGMALPHQEIFSRIAGAMGSPTAESIPEEISRHIPEKAKMILPPWKRRRAPAADGRRRKSRTAFTLLHEKSPHFYHDVSLSGVIPGMSALAPEGTLIMNPDDAGRLGIAEGGRVVIQSSGEEVSCPVAARKNIPPGFVYMQPAIPVFAEKGNPLSVEVVPIADAEAGRPRSGSDHV
jgi:hypothetical protein